MNQNGEKKHLTSAERQKIYMERAADKHHAALSAQERRKRRKVVLAVGGAIAAVLLIVGVWLLISRVIIPEGRYSSAIKLYEAGEYLEAMDAFDAMDGYRDSREYIEKCILEQARALSGREDVLYGTSETMPWFSLADDEGDGLIKFDEDSYTGGGDVEIPDVFDGVLIRGIATRGFYRCDFLTSISLPPSVRIISERAFYGCELLSSVTLPDSVSELGEYAFGKCTALSEVTFGTGLERIGQRAFDGCTALISVEVPNGVSELGYRAFGGCTALEYISLPSSIETVGTQCFTGCGSLKTVVYAGTRERLEELLQNSGDELSGANLVIVENS